MPYTVMDDINYLFKILISKLVNAFSLIIKLTNSMQGRHVSLFVMYIFDDIVAASRLVISMLHDWAIHHIFDCRPES